MNFNFVNFKCTSCDDERTVNIGSYPTTTITDNECPKCTKKTVVVNKDKEIVKTEVKSTAPVIIRNSDRLHSQGMKDTPKEFKQLLKIMKDSHKGSTIVDRS